MSGVRYAADGLPAGREDAEHRELPLGVRVLDDVHLARRDPEGAAVRERLDLVAEVVAPRAAPDPDDLVVEVVVPRRLAGRHVADEHRRAPRAVVRAEEDLERAAAGRLAGLDRVDRDDVVARAHRSVEVGVSAERDANERDPVRAGGELGRLALEQERRRAGLQSAPAELATARMREQQHVVAGIADLARLPRAELQRLERELGAALRRNLAGCADDTHQRPRYALRRPSSSSRSEALPSSTMRPVERT